MLPLILALAGAPVRALAEARGILFPWVPVFLAIGIGGWFSLSVEPGGVFYLGAASVLLAAVLFWHFGPEEAHPFVVALACVLVGVFAAGIRGHMVAAPTLDFRYYGPVMGRIIDIDRSQTDALRLTLDRVRLDRVSPRRTPAKVRVSLHGEQGFLIPEPGQIVQLTGHLSAPEGPVEPGGFDFQRMAWFQRLGAVGYTRTPVLLWADAARYDQVTNRIRDRLSRAVQAAIPGDAGAFSSGVMTGDRAGLSLQAVEDLRKSSLTHLLAISGMNMAFLIGFVFGLVRYGLALVPPLALRINAKKVAAVASLAVAWFYMQLSGSNVATERAFIMVTVMLAAVLLNRRALSLRSVALSAILLLLLKPESLMDPGFQMSFAATTALITGFGAVEGGVLRGRIPRWAMPVFTLVLSSLLAGIATGPYGAAHFNRIADFGFFANLLTVPVMGAVVMPAGAIAALLAPIGLQALPLWVMGKGSGWILYVAHVVAKIDGAISAVPSPGPWVLPLLTLGGLWTMLWRGKGRFAGVGVIGASLFLWGHAERPAMLISPDGNLIGLLGPAGRAISAPRGAGFTAKSWLENDGDLMIQEEASMRSGFDGPKNARSFGLGEWQMMQLTGKTAKDQLAVTCLKVDLVVTTAQIGDAPMGCQVIDAGLLRRTGGLALNLGPDGKLLVQPTITSRRIWHGKRPPSITVTALQKSRY